jgi:hypothetical protein
MQRSHTKKNPKRDIELVTRPSQIILGVIILIRRMMHNQENLMEDLLLFVAKAYVPNFIVENQWLRHLVMHQIPQVVFPN